MVPLSLCLPDILPASLLCCWVPREVSSPQLSQGRDGLIDEAPPALPAPPPAAATAAVAAAVSDGCAVSRRRLAGPPISSSKLCRWVSSTVSTRVGPSVRTSTRTRRCGSPRLLGTASSSSWPTCTRIEIL
jgi:hypothetical protein